VSAGKRREYIWGLGVLSLVGFLYAELMSPHLAGYLYDDGIYLMSGQALLSGQGYSLPGIEGAPLAFKYPPLFPAILGLASAILPPFPANLPVLKGMNILFTLVSLFLIFRYYRTRYQFSLALCLGLLLLLGANYRLIDVSIELMSEPLFLLLSVLLLGWGEQWRRQTGTNPSPPSTRTLLGWVLLSTALFYTRTMAVLMILAMAVWLWLNGYRRQAIQYTVGCGIFAAPWALWSALQPNPTTTLGDFFVRTFQESYFQTIRMSLTHEGNLLEIYAQGINALVGHFATNLFPLLDNLQRPPHAGWGELLTLLLSLALFGLLGLRAWRAVRTQTYSLAGLYVSIYLLILPSWNFFKFYPRFLIVILPFLLGMMVAEVQERWPRQSKLVLTTFISLGLLANLTYLLPYAFRTEQNLMALEPPVPLNREYQATFNWLRTHTPPDAVVYTDNGDEAFFVSLQAQRPTVDFFLFLPKSAIPLSSSESGSPEQIQQETLQAIRQAFIQRAQALPKVWTDKGVAYVLANKASVIKSPVDNRLVVETPFQDVAFLAETAPHLLQPVFTSPAGWVTIYQFTPPETP